jgi:hypothetical protein
MQGRRATCGPLAFMMDMYTDALPDVQESAAAMVAALVLDR